MTQASAAICENSQLDIINLDLSKVFDVVNRYTDRTARDETARDRIAPT